MNPTYYRPINVETHAVHWTGQATEHLYNLRLRYRPDGEWQSVEAVHIPPELEPFFRRGIVTGFHLETLNLQGLANNLPGCPRFVVLGLHSADGKEHVAVPDVFNRTRAQRFLVGVLAIVASAGTCLAAPAVSGALLAAGMGLLWSAHNVLPTPFKVVREVA